MDARAAILIVFLQLLSAFIALGQDSCLLGQSSYTPIESWIGTIIDLSNPAQCNGNLTAFNYSFRSSGTQDNEIFVEFSLWNCSNVDNNIMCHKIEDFTGIENGEIMSGNTGINTRVKTLNRPVPITRGIHLGAFIEEEVVEMIDSSKVSGMLCHDDNSLETESVLCDGQSSLISGELSLTATIVPSECEEPPVPINGRITGLVASSSARYDYGTTLEYECLEGHQRKGAENTTCLSFWSNPPPECVLIDCGDPGQPANGMTIGNNFTFQAQINISCKTGHRVNGSEVLQCEPTGNWSHPLPTCDLISCKDPGIPKNGTRDGSFLYNNVVRFQCNTGFELEGVTTLLCLLNGTWDNNPPLCISQSAAIPTTEMAVAGIVGGTVGGVILIVAISAVVITLAVIAIHCKRKYSEVNINRNWEGEGFVYNQVYKEASAATQKTEANMCYGMRPVSLHIYDQIPYQTAADVIPPQRRSRKGSLARLGSFLPFNIGNRKTTQTVPRRLGSLKDHNRIKKDNIYSTKTL